ncbi:MAG TPA: HAD family hydrolase [Acidimicrobiales bacterium]|nr:HAD family hydrolase [Acidimicrobiales bacterium]
MIWDFDGTIADTFAAIRVASERALAVHGLPPADEATLRSSVGLSLPRIFARLVGTEGGDRLIDALTATYRREFVTAGPQHTSLFPGIEALLAELGDAAVTSVVATSKGRAGVVMMLDRLEIAGHFAGVISDDDVQNKKPHPEMVLTACARDGRLPKDAVVVGDTEFDIEMGRAAGASTIGVTWGNKARADLAGARPTHLVDDVEELASLLRRDVRARTP